MRAVGGQAVCVAQEGVNCHGVQAVNHAVVATEIAYRLHVGVNPHGLYPVAARQFVYSRQLYVAETVICESWCPCLHTVATASVGVGLYVSCGNRACGPIVERIGYRILRHAHLQRGA